MKKKGTLLLYVFLIGLCYVADLPFWYTLRSYIIMPVYDLVVVRNSVLHQKGIEFFIPSGVQTKSKDWYPYMLHHNGSEEFSQYIGKKVSLDILYSFGYFDFWKGSSSFYDMDSSYCAAFYGGYAVFTHDPNRVFGFNKEGHLNIAELEKVPMFDQTRLVLPSVGLPVSRTVFRSQVKDIQVGQSYMNYDDWVQIDVDIQTNAPTHQYKTTEHPGYFQYGKAHSSWYNNFDYPVIPLKGRTYVRYFKEYQATFFLYVMARDEETLNACDQKLLSKSSIRQYN